MAMFAMMAGTLSAVPGATMTTVAVSGGMTVGFTVGVAVSMRSGVAVSRAAVHLFAVSGFRVAVFRFTAVSATMSAAGHSAVTVRTM